MENSFLEANSWSSFCICNSSLSAVFNPWTPPLHMQQLCDYCCESHPFSPGPISNSLSITLTHFQVLTPLLSNIFLRKNHNLLQYQWPINGQPHLSYFCIHLSEIPKFLPMKFSILALLVCLFCFVLSLRHISSSTPIHL